MCGGSTDHTHAPAKAVVPPSPAPGTLSFAQRQRAREAAQAVNAAFWWSTTGEGMSYWSAVYSKLQDLAGGRALKPAVIPVGSKAPAKKKVVAKRKRVVKGKVSRRKAA